MIRNVKYVEVLFNVFYLFLTCIKQVILPVVEGPGAYLALIEQLKNYKIMMRFPPGSNNALID